MKTKPSEKPRDPDQFKKEMDATKVIYDTLVSLPEERREPIFKAVATLLGII